RLHQTANPPWLPADTGWRYRRLYDIAGRCLAKDPGERYADFSEVRAMLQGLLDHDPYETYMRTLPPPEPAKDLDAAELLDKALSLVELRQYERALRAFDQLIERHPTSGRAWLGKGLLLMKAFCRFEEALASLEAAQKLG